MNLKIRKVIDVDEEKGEQKGTRQINNKTIQLHDF